MVPACTAGVEPPAADCVSTADATVEAKAGRRAHRPDRLEVSRAARSIWVDFDPAPGDALLGGLSRGDAVTLEIWRGSVVSVGGRGTTAETRRHPSVAYRHGKATTLYVLSLLVFSVPVAAITLTRRPERRIGRRPWAVFCVVFFPLGGLVLLFMAWPLSADPPSSWSLSIAVPLYAVDACLAMWCAHHARRARDATSPSAVTAMAAMTVFANRRRER